MHFLCSQKRGGQLYINDNEVKDLGVYRNVTGFVPQVCFFLLFYERYFDRISIVLLQEGHGSELLGENISEMVVVFWDT